MHFLSYLLFSQLFIKSADNVFNKSIRFWIRFFFSKEKKEHKKKQRKKLRRSISHDGHILTEMFVRMLARSKPIRQFVRSFVRK